MVAFDPKAQTFHLLGMGYAVGHYARFLSRGAVRVEATSAHPLVQVTAFRDDGRKTVVLVLINNARAAAQLKVSLKGFGNRERLTFKGEQSTAKSFWAEIGPFQSESPAGLALSLPAESVTTISAGL
jgi:O-glycosyl hydrolase